MIGGPLTSTVKPSTISAHVNDQKKVQTATDAQVHKDNELSVVHVDRRQSAPPSSNPRDLPQNPEADQNAGRSSSVEAPAASLQDDPGKQRSNVTEKTISVGSPNTTTIKRGKNERREIVMSDRSKAAIEIATAGSNVKGMPTATNLGTPTQSPKKGSANSAEKMARSRNGKTSRILFPKQSKASCADSHQSLHGGRVSKLPSKSPMPDDPKFQVSHIVTSRSPTPTPTISKASLAGSASSKVAKVPHASTSIATTPPPNAPKGPAGWRETRPSSSPVFKRPQPLSPAKASAPKSDIEAVITQPPKDMIYTPENHFRSVSESEKRRLKESSSERQEASEKKKSKRPAPPSSATELQQSQPKKTKRETLFERSFKDGKMKDTSMTLLRRDK